MRMAYKCNIMSLFWNFLSRKWKVGIDTYPYRLMFHRKHWKVFKNICVRMDATSKLVHNYSNVSVIQHVPTSNSPLSSKSHCFIIADMRWKPSKHDILAPILSVPLNSPPNGGRIFLRYAHTPRSLNDMQKFGLRFSHGPILAKTMRSHTIS